MTKNEKVIQRFFEIIPGLLTWIVILSPVWLGLVYPRAMVYFLTFLTLYWSYLAVLNTLVLAVGYPKYKKEMSQDWYQNCKEIDVAKLPDKDEITTSLEKIKHFILIPCVNEPYQVLKDSFDSFSNQTYPTKSVTLVYTLEEKPSKKTKDDLRKIILQHQDKFDQILFFVHPAGIPGEAKGVGGANRTWGASRAVDFLKSQGKIVRNYI